MQFFCNLNDSRLLPGEWAESRAAEGWHGLLVSDHLWDPAGPKSHLFSVLGALAVSTSTGVSVGSGFANNLMRHPVEFAQASLTLQRISGGRFEAGLGSGWYEEELIRTGRSLASPSERAERLIEAVILVRELFDAGYSSFSGQHYRVHVPRLEDLEGPAPVLVVGAGGERIIRSVAPYVDKLELLPPSIATRSGSMRMDAMNAITHDDVRALIDYARSVRSDLPIRLYVACCAGDDERSARIASMFNQGFFACFYGTPSRVADSILSLADLGIDEVHLAPNDQYTYENLAALVLPAVPDRLT